MFKSARRSTFSDFLIVLFFESCHAIGLAILIFVVFPELDVVKGAMLTNCVAFIPALLSKLSQKFQNGPKKQQAFLSIFLVFFTIPQNWKKNNPFFPGLFSRNNREGNRVLKTIMDLLAIGCQATGFFIWPIVESGRGNTKMWTVAVAIFLVSAGWWENYVDRRSPWRVIKNLGRFKERLKKTRYFTYSFVSTAKMIIFFASMLVCLHFNGTQIGNLFSEFTTAFSAHPINITQIHHTGLAHNVPDIPGAQLLQVN